MLSLRNFGWLLLLGFSAALPTPLEAANSAQVLIVGVEQYPRTGDLPPLTGANREAKQLQRLFLDLQVPAQRITLLTSDNTDWKFQPTRKNIDFYVKLASHRAAPGDLLLVLFTGHGMGSSNASYLCPMDATSASLAAPSPETLIGVESLALAMSKSQAQRKLLIVDACRNLATAGSFVRGLKKPVPGVWIMSSCSHGQIACMESRDRQLPQSIFWTSIAESLRGDADLLGNNSGSVSLFELYSSAYGKTRERARMLNVQQTPELFGGLATPFEVAVVSSFVQAPQLYSSSLELEHRQTANMLANRGVEVVRHGESMFRRQYDLAIKAQRPVPEYAYSDHHQIMSYSLTQYLEPALVVDEKCRLACLGQGWVYRSCGMYADALAAYQRANERLEVFVKGERRTRDAFLESNDRFEDHRVFGRTDNGLELTEVIVRKEPFHDAAEATRVAAHSKLHISRVEGIDPTQQWLLVTHVNDNPLAQPGWLPREAVHWFAEAADVYTSASPLSRGFGSGGGLSRLEEASTGLDNLAQSLDQPAQRLDDIASSIQSLPAARIASRFGFSIPGIGYINQAAGYARIPGNYVRTVGGYARMPANYANTARGWAGVTNSYFDGHERANATEATHLKLHTSAPVRRLEIQLVNAPWSL